MNAQPTKNDPKYQLTFRAWNSYWLEYINEVFNRRMDTVTNALLLILGASVFADSAYSWLFGGIIATLSGCRIAWRFGQRSEASKQQAQRYAAILDNAQDLSIEEISARLSMISEFDGTVMECMDNPARNKASIAMGFKPKEHLNIPEKLIALLTIGIPR